MRAAATIHRVRTDQVLRSILIRLDACKRRKRKSKNPKTIKEMDDLISKLRLEIIILRDLN